MSQIEGEVPDVSTAVRFLTAALERVAPVDALLAICRGDGRPFEKDRALWRALRDRFDVMDVHLADMVIFGRDSVWSMRAEDARSNAVA